MRYIQDGLVSGCKDLSIALSDDSITDTPWRIHFHTPIHSMELLPGFSTTRNLLDEFLKALTDYNGPKPHIEIETYTWSVLPEHLRPKDAQDLITGLTKEFSYLEQKMDAFGLLEN